MFPRNLRKKERDLLLFVLPADSTGYSEYRHFIGEMVVLAEGRRGKGNLVLGRAGDEADITSPLAAVVAYGVVETTNDVFTITVREHVGDQLDVEIVSSRGEEVPDSFEEKARWTYSSWKPSFPSPASQKPVREVVISDSLVLAIAKDEKRMWLHESSTAMNYLIPVTNFYNELMLHKQIRDPRIALNSNLLYESLENYSDADLHHTFLAYNRMHKKVHLLESESVQRAESATSFLKRLFVKR